MIYNDRWPTAVLSERFTEFLRGRCLRSAFFTTYNFDPSFFEIEVLPLLFDQSFSQVTKVRLLQLEDALREVEHLAVYYDRNALSQDATPARLDYRRIDVRRTTGVFHPKLAFLLVDEPIDNDAHLVKPRQSLVIACLSANLSRSGWWENLECAHIVEIRDKAHSPISVSYRSDLLTLLRRIRACGSEEDDHRALETVRQFLLTRTVPCAHVESNTNKRWNVRVFGGERTLKFSDWLSSVDVGRCNWNLEIISPFFDVSGTGPVEDLTNTIAPRETRVFLPLDTDSTAMISAEVYESIAALNGVRWAKLPAQITQRTGGTSGERLAPRRVHAKVYRLWKESGEEIVITGSVNCTSSAHSHGGAGNLEAAFLVDPFEEGCHEKNTWWLQPLEQDAERFVENSPSESDGLDSAPIGVSIRYHWDEHKVFIRVDANKKPQMISVNTVSGRHLFEIQSEGEKRWLELGSSAADEIKKSLSSNSFVLLQCEDKHWRALVREEGMAHRPSILSDLNPDEILEYWSLLSVEERAAFLERHAAIDEKIEGIPAVLTNVELERTETLFDRFAAIFHAFGCLKRHVSSALEEGRMVEAEMRLLGAKYDSLPVLLRKLLEQSDGDPIRNYVSFLTAKQLRNSLAFEHRKFFRDRRNLVRKLDRLIREGISRRNRIFTLDDTQTSEFIVWFEQVFLKDLSHL